MRDLILRKLQKQVEPRLSAYAQPTWRWISSIGLAVAVGIAYFLAARLSLALLTKPDGVAVFWPAAGVAAGVLIALGPGARLPVATGAMAATIVANLFGDRTIWGAIVFAICNAGEAILTAALIEFYFGSSFSLGRLRHVLGLLAAANWDRRIRHRRNRGLRVVPQLDGAGPDHLASLVHVRRTRHHHGCAAADRAWRAVRDPPPRREIVEGGAALATLTA